MLRCGRCLLFQFLREVQISGFSIMAARSPTRMWCALLFLTLALTSRSQIGMFYLISILIRLFAVLVTRAPVCFVPNFAVLSLYCDIHWVVLLA